MNRTTAKTFCLSSAAALALLLGGCDNSEQAKQPADSAGKNPPVQAAAAPAAQPAAQPAGTPAAQPEVTQPVAMVAAAPEGGATGGATAAGSTGKIKIIAEPVPAGFSKVEIKYPKPVIIGTPKAPKGVDPEEVVDFEPYLALPPGAKNIAANKPVTASDKEPVMGELKYVTDGDKEGMEGSRVELGPNLQWVQIDLKKAAEIHAVVMWHHHADVRVYKDVVVQVSDDPDFITDVKTIFNNDRDGSAGLGVGTDREFIEYYQGKRIKPKQPLMGRYVRLYSRGNTSDDQNHYVEVEVYGLEK